MNRLILKYRFFVYIAGAENPCFGNVYKELDDLAKRNPTYTIDAAPLCDRYLTYGWYRAGFNKIPEKAPRFAKCGTLFPYWMDGKTYYYLIIFFHNDILLDTL